MNWYVAKLIFRITSGDGNHKAQFEEQLRLITAEDESVAFEKARIIGGANQDTFLNCHNETVLWQFIGVVEVNHLTDLDDGTELYYSIHEASDADEADRYTACVHHKSALLDNSRRKRVMEIIRFL